MVHFLSHWKENCLELYIKWNFFFVNERIGGRLYKSSEKEQPKSTPSITASVSGFLYTLYSTVFNGIYWPFVCCSCRFLIGKRYKQVQGTLNFLNAIKIAEQFHWFHYTAEIIIYWLHLIYNCVYSSINLNFLKWVLYFTIPCLVSVDIIFLSYNHEWGIFSPWVRWDKQSHFSVFFVNFNSSFL